MSENVKEDRRKITSPINAKLGGRPALFATKLRAALIRKAEEHAEELTEVLFKKARQGDIPALKEFFDRGLGKASQGIDLTTNGKELPQPILANVIKTDAVHIDNSYSEDSRNDQKN